MTITKLIVSHHYNKSIICMSHDYNSKVGQLSCDYNYLVNVLFAKESEMLKNKGYQKKQC